MNRARIFLGIALMTFIWLDASAQVTVLDGPYVKESNPTKRVVPYPGLREADVLWVHRVWQEIDLKEKMNHPLYYPIAPIQGRKSLFDVIRDALSSGSLVAYDVGPTSEDDEFTKALTPEEVEALLNPLVQRKQMNVDDDGYTLVENIEPIKSDAITRYRIKEDWLFDKQRSERYVRIIGICPMKERYDEETGTFMGMQLLFWLYFPECRFVFNMNESFNMQNEAQHRTFEDIFQKRMFSSFIIKEANVYDRQIDSYYQGLDRLLEAEQIKNEMFVLEHDLWHY